MDMHSHSHSHGGEDSAAVNDALGGHGMLVVGTSTSFFSHLPMFMAPHDFQVIFEGTFSATGSDPQRIYKEDRKAHPQTHVYTFNPVEFVMTDLFPPAPKRTQIEGDLFRGHFEHPSEFPEKPVRIAAGVHVTIANLVYFQRLTPHASAPAGLEYLLFGKGDELFLAHLIARPPDFDQVVSARVKGHQFRDDELSRGVRIQLPRTPGASTPGLTKGKTVSGSAQLAGRKITLEIEPVAELYMMERELA
jgi:hypothetical protein